MKTPISRLTVNGNSMLPTLREGQDILSFNWAYLGEKPKVGDIVIVKSEKCNPSTALGTRVQSEMVKRVQKIIGDKIWVVGDNKRESTDSRDFGPVSIDKIVGKLVYASDEIPCPQCGSTVIGIYGRKDAICQNCGFKLSCCE